MFAVVGTVLSRRKPRQLLLSRVLQQGKVPGTLAVSEHKAPE